jgi:hypothetical protein
MKDKKPQKIFPGLLSPRRPALSGKNLCQPINGLTDGWISLEIPFSLVFRLFLSCKKVFEEW